MEMLDLALGANLWKWSMDQILTSEVVEVVREAAGQERLIRSRFNACQWLC